MTVTNIVPYVKRDLSPEDYLLASAPKGVRRALPTSKAMVNRTAVAGQSTRREERPVRKRSVVDEDSDDGTRGTKRVRLDTPAVVTIGPRKKRRRMKGRAKAEVSSDGVRSDVIEVCAVYCSSNSVRS